MYEYAGPEELGLSKSNLVFMLITFQCAVYLLKQKFEAGRYRLYSVANSLKSK